MSGFLEHIHPVLPCRDVNASISFYCDRLGFKVAFQDHKVNPTYAGIRRDGVEIHLQWHDESVFTEGLDAIMLRIITRDIDALYEEYLEQSVFHDHTSLRETSWGTKEFAFYDPCMNGLTFYTDL